MAKRDGPGDIGALVAEARKKPAPVYLLIGEPFQTEAAARALIDVLVPAERRALNLEIYDGRATSIGPVLDSLRMFGLFAGTKVVWVREPALFAAGEKRGDVTSALFAAWEEDRIAEAAERLLVLAAHAGWPDERFVSASWQSLPASDELSLFGRGLEPGERDVLPAIAARARERGVPSAHRDEGGLFEAFLAGGVPAGNVLIFSAAAVDRRKRVIKTLHEAGRVIELTLARERSGALGVESVERLVAQIFSIHGKRVEPAARRLIGERAGNEPALLAGEIEKLCLYVGDATLVREADVRESMRDLAESWIFDFTRALAQRRAAEAIALCRKLFAAGEHPLRLMAMIAREIRLLLLARDCLTGSLAGSFGPNTQYNTFRDRLMPRFGDAEREAFAGVHPYALYQNLQNASRFGSARLRRALLALHRLDVRLKSGAGDPHILLEAFVLDLCRRPENDTGSRRESRTPVAT
jgi:DNA polymerase III delta subunit